MSRSLESFIDLGSRSPPRSSTDHVSQPARQAIPEPLLGRIGGLLWISGLLILAVVTWQTGVLNRWAGILWLVGAVVYATGVPTGPQDTPRATAIVGALIVAVGLTWAGTSMLTLDQDSMCQSPDPVGRSS